MMPVKDPDCSSGISEAIVFSGFEDFLKQTIRHGCHKLDCAGGYVFLLDGATGGLFPVAHFFESSTNFSPAMVEKLAEQTFVWKNLVFSTRTKPFRDDATPLFSLSEQPHVVVGMPVLVFERPLAVFCFCFERAPTGSVGAEAVLGFSASEEHAIQKFWEELRSREFTSAFRERLVLQLEKDLHAVGEAPLTLKEELDRFVSKMNQAYRDSGRPVPDTLYVQLVDVHQRMIRTIRGFGMPLSFEYMPAHSLDSTDIHAAIVKERNVEVIVGTDSERFDERIYNQYDHRRYARLWFPLFPFPARPSPSSRVSELERDIKALLTWRSEEESPDGKMKRRVAEWVAG